jgi:hypothetical protein
MRGNLIRKSYAQVFSNLGAICRIMWFWGGIWLIGMIALSWVVYRLGILPDLLTTGTANLPQSWLPAIFVLSFAATVLQFFAVTVISIQWLRLGVLDERPAGNFASFRGRGWRFIWRSILYLLLMALVMMLVFMPLFIVLGLIGALLSNVLGNGPMVLLGALGSIILIAAWIWVSALMLRYALVFPAVAADRETSFAHARAISRGRGRDLFLAVLAIAVPLLVVQIIVTGLGQTALYLMAKEGIYLAAAVALAVTNALGFVIGALGYFGFLSVLAIAYRQITNEASERADRWN